MLDYLKNCSQINVKDKNLSELADILNANTDGASTFQRVESFIKSVKNPYCFRVNDTRVKVVFSKSKAAPSLEAALVNIANGKNG